MKTRVVATLIAMLAVFVPGVAHAQTSCSNTACVASALKANHVYVDPAAEVKTDKADELRAKIGSNPIYIAFLPTKAADAYGGVDKLPGVIGKAMGIPAVVGVISGKSFRATSGGNVGLSSSQTATLATNAFNANSPGKFGGDTTPLLTDFISRVQSAPKSKATSSSGSTSTTKKDKGTSGWVIFLWVVIILVFAVSAIVGVIVLLNIQKRKKRKAMLKSKIGSLGSSLFELQNAGHTFNTEAAANLDEAWSKYRNAENNLTADDLDGAERELQGAQRKCDAADRMKNKPEPVPEPPPEPVTVPLKSGVRKKAGQPRVESAQIDPQGRVVINNNVQVPSSSYSQQSPYYFPGGYYGGRYMGGGYYGMNFWDYMILDSIMDDRRDGDRGDHDDSDRGSGGGDSGGGDWGGGSTDTGGGDWGGGDSGVSVGGGDWGGGGDSGGGGYSAPDPTPDYGGGGGFGGGGGDWGGGGGGGDFGGGGDSGGGGW